MADIFNQHQRGLRSREQKTRVRAARSIKNYIESEHRDLQNEAYQRLVSSLMSKIMEMLQSPDSNDKIGAVTAMDELLDAFAEQNNEGRIMEIAGALIHIFEAPILVENPAFWAAKVLGHLVSIGGTAVLEFIEKYHLVPALQWLQNEKFQNRRCAAVLVLKELATNAPTMFYRHVESFFDCIWSGISDKSKYNRESAAMALRAAILLVQQRDSRQRLQWYKKLQERVEKGLVDKAPESIHGAFLIENELIRNTGDYMHQYYEQVCKTVLSSTYINHKSPIVRQAAIMLLPQLAKFNTSSFISDDLRPAMKVLLRLIERPNSCRADAFIAMGRLAEAVGSALVDPPQILDQILRYIKDALSEQRKKEFDAYDEALICLRMLASHTPHAFVRVDLRDIIDSMFLRGLNRSLLDTLIKLVHKLPSERQHIQYTLFHTLHSILVRSTVDLDGPPPSAPRRTQSRSISVDRVPPQIRTSPALTKFISAGYSMMMPGNPTEQAVQLPTVGSVTLALETLGSFDFSGNRHIPIVQFVHDVVVKFLEDDDPFVRKAAAVTCCKLLLSPGENAPTKGETGAIVGAVIERLLTVGIADMEADIRAKVLSSLDSRFDSLLGQPDSLRSLFIALNDEVFEIRETAMNMLGRLSQRNPAFVMPALRQMLVRLLAELEFGGDSRSKEESSRLLGHLIQGSSHLVKPYAVPILKALTQNIRQNNVGVEAAVLATLGRLSSVAGQELRPYLDLLLPEIVLVLQEQAAPQKIQVALTTLAQIVRSTGYVIKPYFDHPDLMDSLVSVLQRSGETNWSLRREASRTLGTLGALDPFKLRMIQMKAKGMLTLSQTASPYLWPQELQLTSPDVPIHKDDATLKLLQRLAQDRSDLAGKTVGVQGQHSLDLMAPAEMLPSLVEHPNLYFETVAIYALVRIMNDARTRPHIKTTAQAIMFICKNLGARLKPFLGIITQSFLQTITRVNSELREFILQQLTLLCSVMKRHIQPHLDGSFIVVIRDYWDLHLTAMLRLVEAVARAIEEDFRLYLSDVIPAMLRIMRRERDNPSRPCTQQILDTIATLVPVIANGYMYFILPAILKLIQDSSIDTRPRKKALLTLRQLVRQINVSTYASRIIHPLTRVASADPQELGPCAVDILCVMVTQLGPDYAIFVPMVYQYINKQTYKNVPEFEKYENLVSRVLKHQPLPQEPWQLEQQRRNNLKIKAQEKEREDEEVGADEEVKKRPINYQNLMKAWDASNRSTKDDWNEWMRTFSMEILRASPSVALHACVAVASVYQPLAMDLFNAAFVSSWPALQTSSQESLARALETAFQSPNLPPEILQTLLNLSEFMEHVESLPMEPRMLAGLAEKVHSYAKALYYQELAFNAKPDPAGIEALISINNKLSQPEAAIGILKHAQKNLQGIEVKASWYEKLQRWSDALEAHEQVLAKNPNEVDSLIGRLRCLKALGDWISVDELVNELYNRVYNPNQRDRQRLNMQPQMRAELCSLGTYAVVALGKWEEIPRFLIHDFDPVKREMFQAICHIKSENFSAAKENIEQARVLLDPLLRALVSESFQRAYNPHIVDCQLLAELEDLVEFRVLVQQQPYSKESSQERLKQLRKMWTVRMLGAERSIEVWQHLLVLRGLLMDPVDDVETWLRYSSLCRENGALNLEKNALIKVGAHEFFQSIKVNPYQPLPVVFHDPNLSKHRPKVAFSFLRHLWAEGMEDVAIYQLSELTAALERRDDKDPEMIELRVKCHLRLGDWLLAHSEHTTGPDAKIYDEILDTLQTATRLSVDNYKAWHKWALINFRLTTFYPKEEIQQVSRHALAAMNGFFRSVFLGQQGNRSSVIQDVLRLLTIWFTYGHRKEVHEAMASGNHSVASETWLQVVPQLIARIHTSNALMNHLLQTLLSRIGHEHPQGLIYPIMVAYKSSSPHRRLSAKTILDEMRRHSPSLVSEAELVSHELIRVAIQWPEMWHEGLEDAAKHCFTENNPDGMLQVLAPLHEMLEGMDKGGHEPTIREVAFHQAFARDLWEAKEWTDRYQKTRKEEDLNQAWDLYYYVFRRIQKQFAQMQTLELENAAPKLLSATDLTLAVPGTYHPGNAIVRIRSFHPSVQILTSKQRPRKITINGSDGKPHMFLLKGHEDLRQDERVMQLFGLINTLLQSDRDTSKRNLAIKRYSVLPLSHTAGMIGWVPNCDTLHQLIRDYREARKIPLNVEHRLMLRMAPDYDKLAVPMKIEVFEDVLQHTTGQDLSKVLWLKSQNSEVWLERRKSYSRSLALMSMVGYILGLGDRHPSNLMLERSTGKIVHIDFGDCFEVAMQRDKYPEKIPFRLTRMMTTAMEVSGIEGHFRFTCEGTMKVLRDNRDSLMAALEAFVHDPLINWRLLTKNMASPSHAHEQDHDTDDLDRSIDDDDMGKSTGERDRGGGARKMAARALQRASTVRGSMAAMVDGNGLRLSGSSSSSDQGHVKQGFVEDNEGAPTEELNERAVNVITRVQNKLRGRDFNEKIQLSVSEQVDRLIRQATSIENLCQCYIGWCPFW